jgi:hypothetical protein
MIARDGLSAICQRVESDTEWGEAGFLHSTDLDPSEVPPMQPPRPGYLPKALSGMVIRWLDAADRDSEVGALAHELGLTGTSLRRLRVGWRGDCYTFPMVDDRGNVVGFRFRGKDGRKWSLAGGRNGLFIPTGLLGYSRSFVVEGPTDCAAALDMGLSAVGRPNCVGGFEYLEPLFRATRGVPIVADRDEAGIRGAIKLAEKFRNSGAIVIAPKRAKDLRDYNNKRFPVRYLVDASYGHPNHHWSVEYQL